MGIKKQEQIQRNTTQKIKEMNNSKMLEITMHKHTQKI
jgi:hypothetical protein